MGSRNPRPGTDAFLQSVWRQRPVLYRSFFPLATLKEFEDGPARWCRSPAVCRVFVPDKSGAGGRTTSRIVPDPAQAWRIYQTYHAFDQLTLLLNLVEKVDPGLRALQDAFDIPFRWRMDDIVATLSSRGSGIGYHAGIEDGFICQISGSRRWRVWSSDCVPNDYRRSLLGDAVGDGHPHVQRPDCAPLIDCELLPGDVLYNPALFPHEGETIEESVSLSLAWQGLSPYDVLVGAVGAEAAERFASQTVRKHELFVLIPDVLQADESVSVMTDFVARSFDASGIDAPTRLTIKRVLERLVTQQRPVPIEG